MALNWDNMIEKGRNTSSSRIDWDELLSRHENNFSSNNSGRTIPSGYEGTEYEGMTNDEIVERVRQKQEIYDEEEKQRRERIQLQNELRERNIREAQIAREAERQQKEAAGNQLREAVNTGRTLAETAKNINKSEQPESKGWFLDLAKGLKDTLASIPVGFFEAGKRNRYDFSGSRQRKERSN